MKKKAFTLIELIGIIILLGVITLVTVPVVNSTIRNSKEKALQQTIYNLESAARSYSSRNDLGYSSKVQVLSISDLRETGYVKNENLINPITDEPLDGCIFYRWDDNNKQYQISYDGDCELKDLTVSINNLTGEFNDLGWANKDFYVGIETNGLSYNYCVSNEKCSPNSTVNSSNGSAYVSIESDTIYVCAYAIDGNITSETICNEEAYKLDKTKPSPGGINIVSGEKIFAENEWFISDVELSEIDGIDNLSGHKSTILDKTIVEGDTSDSKVVVTTTDNAGNISTKEFVIKIDKKDPAVSISKSVVNNKIVFKATTNEVLSGFTYEWYKDGILIANETNDTFQVSDVGTYKVKAITGSGKTVFSNEFIITGYSITYNLNGGTGSIDRHFKPEDINVNIISTIPKREGYQFIGWGLTDSQTTPTYNSGDLYNKNENVVLYAIWKKTLTITFKGNGATLSYNSATCEIYNDSTSCEVMTPTVTRAGYKFLGFNTATSDVEASKLTESSLLYNKSTGKLTINLNNIGSVWYAITYKTLTASFDANGATLSSSDTRTCNVYNTNSSCNLTLPTITRNTPYVVIGFNLSATSKDSIVGSGGTVTLTNDTKYYAITKKTLTVTFNGNGATSGSTTSQSCYMYNTDSACGIKLNSNGFNKTNYGFKGWGITTTSVKYNPSTTYDFDKDTTLYAIWEELYDGLTNVAYTVGQTVTYQGIEFLVVKDNGDTVTLVTKNNVGTGAFGTNTTFSGSLAYNYVNNTWVNNNSGIAEEIEKGGIVLDSSTNSYVRLLKDTELSTKLPNGSGTNFWTMSSNGTKVYYGLPNGSNSYTKYTSSANETGVCYTGSSTDLSAIKNSYTENSIATSTETALAVPSATTAVSSMSYTLSANGSCLADYTESIEKMVEACNCTGTNCSDTYECTKTTTFNTILTTKTSTLGSSCVGYSCTASTTNYTTNKTSTISTPYSTSTWCTSSTTRTTSTIYYNTTEAVTTKYHHGTSATTTKYYTTMSPTKVLYYPSTTTTRSRTSYTTKTTSSESLYTSSILSYSYGWSTTKSTVKKTTTSTIKDYGYTTSTLSYGYGYTTSKTTESKKTTKIDKYYDYTTSILSYGYGYSTSKTTISKKTTKTDEYYDYTSSIASYGYGYTTTTNVQYKTTSTISKNYSTTLTTTNTRTAFTTRVTNSVSEYNYSTMTKTLSTVKPTTTKTYYSKTTTYWRSTSVTSIKTNSYLTTTDYTTYTTRTGNPLKSYTILTTSFLSAGPSYITGSSTSKFYTTYSTVYYYSTKANNYCGAEEPGNTNKCTNYGCTYWVYSYNDGAEDCYNWLMLTSIKYLSKYTTTYSKYTKTTSKDYWTTKPVSYSYDYPTHTKTSALLSTVTTKTSYKSTTTTKASTSSKATATSTLKTTILNATTTTSSTLKTIYYDYATDIVTKYYDTTSTRYTTKSTTINYRYTTIYDTITNSSKTKSYYTSWVNNTRYSTTMYYYTTLYSTDTLSSRTKTYRTEWINNTRYSTTTYYYTTQYSTDILSSKTQTYRTSWINTTISSFTTYSYTASTNYSSWKTTTNTYYTQWIYSTSHYSTLIPTTTYYDRSITTTSRKTYFTTITKSASTFYGTSVTSSQTLFTIYATHADYKESYSCVARTTSTYSKYASMSYGSIPAETLCVGSKCTNYTTSFSYLKTTKLTSTPYQTTCGNQSASCSMCDSCEVEYTLYTASGSNVEWNRYIVTESTNAMGYRAVITVRKK